MRSNERLRLSVTCTTYTSMPIIWERNKQQQQTTKDTTHLKVNRCHEQQKKWTFKQFRMQRHKHFSAYQIIHRLSNLNFLSIFFCLSSCLRWVELRVDVKGDDARSKGGKMLIWCSDYWSVSKQKISCHPKDHFYHEKRAEIFLCYSVPFCVAVQCFISSGITEDEQVKWIPDSFV